MNDKDKALESRLQLAQNEAEKDRIPDFSTVWAAAEKQAASSRKRAWPVGAAVAATLLAVVAVGLLRPAGQDWQYVDPQEFESSTSWVAPSDVLLPDHRVDIYREVPVLIESTRIEEGALL